MLWHGKGVTTYANVNVYRRRSVQKPDKIWAASSEWSVCLYKSEKSVLGGSGKAGRWRQNFRLFGLIDFLGDFSIVGNVFCVWFFFVMYFFFLVLKLSDKWCSWQIYVIAYCWLDIIIFGKSSLKYGNFERIYRKE